MTTTVIEASGVTSVTGVQEITPKLPIKEILFPFDFSEQCSSAALFVKEMASVFGAHVTLLNVVAPPWKREGGNDSLQPGDFKHLSGDAKARFDSVVAGEFANRVECVTDWGDPASQITQFADSKGADLIMMPTHGYGRFGSLIIGSVTSKVLHEAKTPVWTAAHVKRLTGVHVSCRSILCAVDVTPHSVELLKWATVFSRQLGATLNVLHAVPVVSDWTSLESERLLQEETREQARVKLNAICKSAGVDAPLCVGVGDAAETVSEEARRHGADLVLIGRGSIQQPMGRLRTNALKIIQRCPCPVLSI